MAAGAAQGTVPARNAREAVGSPTALRHANRDRVLGHLRSAGTTSQSDLARATGLSRATVLNIVRELADSGLVTMADGQRGGRRTVEVSLNRRAGAVLGVDFGHQHLRVAVADLSHNVLAEDSHRLKLGHDAKDDLRLLAHNLDRLLARADVRRDEILGMGLGLPAPVDPATGEVGSSSILPGWVGVPAAETVAKTFGIPVVIDNDANLGALAEMTWGSARGYEDLVYIKASTGVGAGLVLHGQIYRGAAGTAGEIGHMTIDEAGAMCRCGNRGCLESYAGVEALLQLVRASHGPDITPQRLLDLATEGDPGARRVLADAGRYIGVAVANLCNLIAPQLVVVGGELAAVGDVLVNPIRDMVQRRSIPTAAHTAQIVLGGLGERAEVLGGVARALLEVTPEQLMRAPP